MKRIHHRNCKNCNELFLPDRRNLRHQTYCSKPLCRQASKKDSQRRWLAKPGNRDYFRGPAHVARVQAWHAAHPGYWRRPRPQVSPALQEHYHPQGVDLNKKIAALPSQISGNDTALQDLLHAQPFVLIGLIAKLTGSALQEAMPHAA